MCSDKGNDTTMNFECDYCKDKKNDKKCVACESTLDDFGFREVIPQPKGIHKCDLKIYITGNTYHIFSKDKKPEAAKRELHNMQFSRTFTKPLRIVKLVEEDGHLFVVGEFFSVNNKKKEEENK